MQGDHQTTGHGHTGGDDRIAPAMSTQDDRGAIVVGVALLAAWGALALSGGGRDLGKLEAGVGPLAFALTMIVVPLAAMIALSRPAPDWSPLARLVIAASGGFAIWSAVSIAWATAPDLAWLATNRAALGCAALLAGAALARTIVDAPARVAIGLALAGAPALAWALATRVAPELIAPAGETARLAAPFPASNTLSIVAALTVPGAALLLGRAGGWRMAGSAILTGAVAVVLLTQSRSGALSLLIALVLCLWLLPGRARVLAGIGGAVLGAAPTVIYVALTPALNAVPQLPDPATRRVPGLVIGTLLVIGVMLATMATTALTGPARALGRLVGRRGRAAVAAIALAVLLAGGLHLAFGDRVAHIPGLSRLLSSDSNNRSGWWDEAWQGFLSAPVVGHGAGSFPLTHLQERTAAVDGNEVRNAHQLVLETLSETGVVGALLGLLGIIATLAAARVAGRRVAPATIVLVTALLHAQLDVTWTVPAVLVAAMGAAGVIVGSPTARTGPRTRQTQAWWLVPLVVAAAASGVLPWWAGRQARAADIARIRGDEAQALRLAESAHRWNPLAIHGDLIAARIAHDTDRAVRAEEFAIDATRRQPENPIAWECLVLTGRGQLSFDAMTQVRRLDPAAPLATANPECRPR